jgi:hypothetical protein
MNSRIFEKRIFKKQRKENSKIGLCHDLALSVLCNENHPGLLAPGPHGENPARLRSTF